MMKNSDQQANPIMQAIAERIQKIRHEKRLSLQKLAQKTGFTKSYLSQIENLKREPPISSLTKIAYALGEDVLFLVTGQKPEEDEPRFTVVKPHERKTVIRPGGSLEYIYESVAYKKKDRLMDAYIVTVGFEFPAEPMVHEGQELAFMLEGKQEIIYDGKRYIVQEGDCMCFDSKRLHYSRSIGSKPAKILVVFVGERRRSH